MHSLKINKAVDLYHDNILFAAKIQFENLALENIPVLCKPNQLYSQGSLTILLDKIVKDKPKCDIT